MWICAGSLLTQTPIVLHLPQADAKGDQLLDCPIDEIDVSDKGTFPTLGTCCMRVWGRGFPAEAALETFNKRLQHYASWCGRYVSRS